MTAPAVRGASVARVLYDVTQCLSAVDGADARIRYALELLGRLLPYDRCAVLHVMPGREEVLILAEESPEARATMGPALRYLFSRLAERAEDEVGGGSSASHVLEVPAQSKSGAHLAAPLVVLDEVVGVLVVQRAAEAYGEEDLGLLSVVASQLASYLTALQTRERERQRARELEAGQRREAFLAAASQALASSLDHDATLEAVAQLAVPTLAELCAVHVRDANGSLRCAAVAHVDPASEALLREILPRFAPRLEAAAEALGTESANPIARALHTGEVQLIPDAPPTLLLATDAPPPVHAIRGLDVCSALVAPLSARGQTFGTITFATGAGGHRYGQADLAIAEDLAARCALAVDNARLHTQARAGLRLRDAVLAMVSHDLKNPLAAIQGHAQLLQRQLGRLELPQRERLMAGASNASAAATRMARQIDELLDVARLGAGEVLQLARRPTDLVALAKSATVRVGRIGERHRLRVAAPDTPVIGEWDPDRLERVLDNLIGNALKYSPAGGDIQVVVSQQGEEAVLAVHDAGIGIPAEDLPYVFEPFRRAANVLEHIRGSGLGLASVRAIVEQHGGSISVTSRTGVEGGSHESGSVFTVRLPLSGVAPAPAAPAGAAGPPLGSGEPVS